MGGLLVGARWPGLATRTQPICYSQFPVLGLAAQIVAGGRARIGVEAGDHLGAAQRIDLVVLVLVGAGDSRVYRDGVIFYEHTGADRLAMISAAMEMAVSAGPRLPMSRPIGLDSVARLSGRRPAAARSRRRLVSAVSDPMAPT